MLKRVLPFVTFILLLGPGSAVAENGAEEKLERDFDRNSRRAVERDAFPVLNNPKMVSKNKGDQFLRPSDWIIGVANKKEAKAYPIAVMGGHELANDTLGGNPIAVSW